MDAITGEALYSLSEDKLLRVRELEDNMPETLVSLYTFPFYSYILLRKGKINLIIYSFFLFPFSLQF